MYKKGFDSIKYIRIQSKAIIERAKKFNKLYLEFGGKLLYDYHASRVLPGYELDNKMQVIKKLAKEKELEFLFCVSACDIETNKKMGSLGINYRNFSLKMIDSIEDYGFKVPTVVVTLFSGEKKAKEFGNYLKKKKYKVYYTNLIKGYPENIKSIVSGKGFGKKPFIKTRSPVVIITGAGPGSGKMSTCLRIVYQDYLNKKNSGYAKFETFPIWNIKLNSPINLAYEAATADIGDYNLIDPYHLKKYKIKAVNYNRDVKNFKIIQRLLKKIISKDNYMQNYFSPTDMGINTAKHAISNFNICEKAARQEIIRRYFRYYNELISGLGNKNTVKIVENLMKKNKIPFSERPVVAAARNEARNAQKQKAGHRNMYVGSALQLQDNIIVTGRNSALMHAESAAIINALKKLSGISAGDHILAQGALIQVKKLRKKVYNETSENLDIPEILIILAISAKMNKTSEKAFSQLKKLRFCEMHTTHFVLREGKNKLRMLGINITSDGKLETGKLYVG